MNSPVRKKFMQGWSIFSPIHHAVWAALHKEAIEANLGDLAGWVPDDHRRVNIVLNQVK